jgi:glycosyltransferase involved in cell wall biosynthesis
MGRPRVLIDGVAFETATRIGIWRLFYEVISRTSADIDYTLLLNGKAAQPIPTGMKVWKIGPRYDRDSRRDLPLKILNWPLEARLKRQFGDAIWHSTFFTLDPRRKTKVVVSLYDMIAETAYSIGPYFEQRRSKTSCLNQANAVLAISQTTAKDCMRFFPQVAPLVRVVHLGHEHLTFNSASQQSNRQTLGDYCLYVGGRYAYKNFSTLVEAVGTTEWPQRLKLVVVGSPFDDAELAWIRANKVGDRILNIGNVSDHELATIYQQAHCFVFPSLLEGFGVPVVESQFARTVPVLSDICIFREIAGDGAIYVDPFSPRSIATGVGKALLPDTCNNVLEYASRNFVRFSWETAAAKTVECYEDVFADSQRQ